VRDRLSRSQVQQQVFLGSHLTGAISSVISKSGSPVTTSPLT